MIQEEGNSLIKNIYYLWNHHTIEQKINFKLHIIDDHQTL